MIFFLSQTEGGEVTKYETMIKEEKYLLKKIQDHIKSHIVFLPSGEIYDTFYAKHTGLTTLREMNSQLYKAFLIYHQGDIPVSFEKEILK